MTREVMRLSDLLERYQSGDEEHLTVEASHLEKAHPTRLLHLTDSVRRDGILEPIALGNDGRVWDGHHRIAVAIKLGLDRVPVEHVGGEQGE